MSQEKNSVTILRAVEQLEDKELSSHRTRNQSYLSIQYDLDSGGGMDRNLANKLLNLCIHDLANDMRYAVEALNIIKTIVKKPKNDDSPLPEELVSSAVALLNFLHKIESTLTLNKLKILCLETILSYSHETLISLANEHPHKILYLLESTFINSADYIIELLNLLTKILNLLKNKDKLNFLKNGLDYWFKFIIPHTFANACLKNYLFDKLLDFLELLADDLHDLRYENHIVWLEDVLVNMYTPDKYPSIIMSMLDSQSSAWDKLFIVTVKLLNTQLTKNDKCSTKNPINVLLPILEKAFKSSNFATRSKAFNCWNALIDIFSREAYIQKKIKLLMVPLLANNAKNEETALVKLNTWWHLIIRYESHIYNLLDNVLLPLLHFCFGKNQGNGATAASLMTTQVKRQCVQMFVEIIGHDDDCGSVPKLKNPILNPTVLNKSRRDWIHFYKTCLNFTIELEMTPQIVCVWKSCLKNISEITINEKSMELVNEIIKILTLYLKKREKDSNFNILYNCLILPLFQDQQMMRLICQVEENSQNFLLLLVNNCVANLKESCTTQESIIKLMTISSVILKNNSYIFERILSNMPANDSTLLLWIAFAKSLKETEKYELGVISISKLLLWPLQNIKSFKNVEAPAIPWYQLFNTKLPVLRKSFDLLEFVTTIRNNYDDVNAYFILYALVAILKETTSDPKRMHVEKSDAQLLLKVINRLPNLKFTDDIFPDVMLVVTNLVNNLVFNVNAKFAETILSCAVIVIKIYMEEQIQQKDYILSEPLKHFFSAVKNLLKSISEKKPKSGIVENIRSNTKILEGLLSYRSYFHKLSPQIKSDVLSILKYFVSCLDNSSDIYKEAQLVIDLLECNPIVKILPESNILKKYTSDNVFNTPKIKLTMKSKISGTNIVNTVTENGEDFVVVKSNWKFNPKKLTEVQKEKLSKKRDDIPALYQDLSQSQDELRVWRTDSQDASSTTSSSTIKNQVNGDASSILKSIANADIVPHIISNILVKDKTKEHNNVTVSPQTPGKRRLTIKDKVAKNLKVLVDSCNNKTKTCEFNSTITVLEFSTPISKNTQDNMQNIKSAPPKINPERPNRVKKTPKKFDNVKLFDLKRTYRKQEISDNAQFTEKSSNIDNALNESDASSNNNSTISKSVAKLNKNSYQNIDKNSPHNLNEEIILNTNSIGTELDSLSKNHLNNDAQIDRNSVINFESKTTNSKKNEPKIPRIVKQLAIDMVQGHPSLHSGADLEKRMRRKCINNNSTVNTPTKKIPPDNLNKESQNKISTKKEAAKEINNEPKTTEDTLIINETQERNSNIMEDPVCSEDFIESSQDSSVTTVSVRSGRTLNKNSCQLKNQEQNNEDICDIRDSPSGSINIRNSSMDSVDISLPQNKVASQEISYRNFTEELDTELVNDRALLSYNYDCVLNKDYLINTEKNPSTEIMPNNNTTNVLIPEHTGIGSQNTANADTEPVDNMEYETLIKIEEIQDKGQQVISICTQEFQPTSTCILISTSPPENKDQRQKEFLVNTMKLSPIKNLPAVHEITASPQESMDENYDVIKLTSPVQCNGEPFSSSGSPEVFTRDNESPENRESTPPREKAQHDNSSPTSPLSLKKNRTQVRSGGRGAQMLRLIPEKLTSKSSDIETVSDDKADDDFLILKKLPPTHDSSPAGPILKRKFVQDDDASASPASKRKRVSFHDPPVSTMISVQKYIEPGSVRSPQHCGLKRFIEKAARGQGNLKSQRRLDSHFKLDTHTKTVDSFTDSCDSEMNSSLEQTPAVEIVKICELNNTDPICPQLINCTDSIDSIATELSSPTMRDVFLKALDEKVKTVGDLAKMTELEINRLCIKAPKIEVSKKVLNDYFKKWNNKIEIIEIVNDSIVPEKEVANVHIQTNEVYTSDAHMQTEACVGAASTQTDCAAARDFETQTTASSFMSTKDVITLTMTERPDYVNCLGETLDEAALLKVANNLPLNCHLDLIAKKTNVLRQLSCDDVESFCYEYITQKLSDKKIVSLSSKLLQFLDGSMNK